MKAGFGSIIGRRHAAEPEEAMRVCQDVADSYIDDEVSIIAVADGKAGKNLPAAAVAAARVNIDTIIAFFRDPATWHIREKSQFKETALRMLESSLETVAGGEEFSYEELCATVTAVAVRKSGEFLAVSIGDSALVAFDAEMNPKVLIPPYREGAKNRTVFTNDINGSRAHMAVRGGSLKKSQYIAFAAFTDGADSLVRRIADGADTLRMAAACTILGSGEEIIQKVIRDISQKYSRDDVSLAVLGAETSEAEAAARAVLKEQRQKRAAQPEKATEEEVAVTAPVPEKTQPAATVPEERPAAETVKPAEEKPADPGTPAPREATVLRAVFAEPQTAQALVNSGHIRKGRVLETVLPLLRANRIRYEDGKFYGNE